MADKISKMPVGHDFAPGSEPDFWEMFVAQFTKIMTTPAALTAIAIGTVLLTFYAIYRIIKGRRRPGLEPAPRIPDEGIKEDLATLRRKRQEKTQSISKLDAA